MENKLVIKRIQFNNNLTKDSNIKTSLLKHEAQNFKSLVLDIFTRTTKRPIFNSTLKKMPQKKHKMSTSKVHNAKDYFKINENTFYLIKIFIYISRYLPNSFSDLLLCK